MEGRANDHDRPETLADLRSLFGKYEIEDWEPIPGQEDHSYSVRYLRYAKASAGAELTVLGCEAFPQESCRLHLATEFNRLRC